jgi:hypothetical protein
MPSSAAPGAPAADDTALLPATGARSVLPPYPTFPASDPDSIGVIDAYGLALATSMTGCGLRDQGYLDIIERTVQGSLAQTSPEQRAIFQRLHGNGANSHFILPSCGDYENHAEFSSMIVSMDNFVNISRLPAGSSGAD